MTNQAALAGNSRIRNVVSLVYNGLCTFEFGITAEVFGLPRPELDCNWYRFSAVSVEKGRLRASGGLDFSATGTLEDIERAGTIIIPGWRGNNAPVPRSMKNILRDAHGRGARLVSICSGAYVLAAAGLLDGKHATTHWRYSQDFARRHPGVRMRPDKLYVEDGNVLTSAGSSAGIDLCLHIVRSDYGAEIANSVARRLVMHAHRQGGQRQFIQQPIPSEYEADRLSSILDYVRSNLGQAHSIKSLAKRCGMSARTFQRRFSALTGTPVGKWVTQERLTRACTLLETSSASLIDVGIAVGISDIGGLQYHFRRVFGVSPGQYRKRFTV